MITFERHALDVVDPDGRVKSVCRDIPGVCRSLFRHKPVYLKKNGWANKAGISLTSIENIQEDLPGTAWKTLCSAADAIDLELIVVVAKKGSI